MSRIARVRDDLRRMGLGGWLVHASSKLVARLSFGRVRVLALRFYVQPVARARLLPPRRAADSIRVEPVTRQAFTAEDFGRPADAIRDRFDDGAVCIAAVKGDALLGFMWLQQDVLRERLVRCRLHALPADRVAWDFDFHIEPQYRLGRLFARLWDRAFDTLRERGIDATVSWIRFENRSSEHAHLRLGARRLGWAVFVTAFEHQLMLGSMRPLLAYARPGETADLYVDATQFVDAGNASGAASEPRG